MGCSDVERKNQLIFASINNSPERAVNKDRKHYRVFFISFLKINPLI